MLYSAFIFGLISSLHCIAMCGPIALMLPVERNRPMLKAIQILCYQLGRLCAYATLGLVFGILGRGFYLAGLQQKMAVLAGLLMIVLALVPENILVKYNFSKPVYKVVAKLKSHLSSQFRRKTLDALFIIGVLNGFLPCGLVYAALFGAIAMQNITLSISYMLLYGLGTIPMMSAVAYIANLIPNRFRYQAQKLIPIATVCIGILFIIRGLGLDIPYLSPGKLHLLVRANAACH